MALDPDRLRGWVYDALICPPHQVGANSGGLQLGDISRWVKQKAQQSGFIQQDQHFGSNTNLDKKDEDAIRSCIWSLIIQGIVIPGISTDSSGSNLPWLQVTEWGKTCLENGEYVPYDTGLFFKQLRIKIPNLDQTVALYLKEALNSFQSGSYLAVAVMTGVASERILVMLRDGIHGAISDPSRKRKFMTATERKTAKHIYQEVHGRLDPIREQLPSDLQDALGAELEGIFYLIRRTRNDSGHPTGKVIDRGEANALLQMFPVYAKTAHVLLDWLKVNPI